MALLRAEVAELRAAGRTGGSSAARTGSSSGGRASGSAPATGGSKSRSRSAGSSAAGAAAGTGSGAASSAASGSAGGGASAQAILQTTSTELVATVSLDATKQYEAVLGEQVTVQMPDGTTVDGRLSQVAAAATSTSSSGSSSAAGGSGGSSSAGGSGSGTTTSTVPVTITLHGRRRTRALDQAAVSVNFQQQQAKGVLSVPVTALLATAGGGYAIQEAAGSHRLLAVTPSPPTWPAGSRGRSQNAHPRRRLPAATPTSMPRTRTAEILRGPGRNTTLPRVTVPVCVCP